MLHGKTVSVEKSTTIAVGLANSVFEVLNAFEPTSTNLSTPRGGSRRWRIHPPAGRTARAGPRHRRGPGGLPHRVGGPAMLLAIAAVWRARRPA